MSLFPKIKKMCIYKCGICKEQFLGVNIASHKLTCAPKLSNVRYSWCISKVQNRIQNPISDIKDVVENKQHKNKKKRVSSYPKKYPNSPFSFATGYSTEDEKVINIKIGRSAFYPKKR